MMAQIKVVLSGALVDGMDIKFKAPCDCTEVDGLIVKYPMEGDTTGSQEFTFKDAHGVDLVGIGNLFSKGAYVKVIVDTVNGFAYLQNADNNSYLHSAVLGTYTQSAATLTGSGVNGKFKCTESGTYGSLQVNGSWCNVRQGEESTIDLIAGNWYTFILDGDTVNFNAGGAGAGLTFKVVGGTSAPASPSEGTIWVNTDQKITSWHFGTDEPNVHDVKTIDANDIHQLIAPYRLSEGDLLSFVIPATVTGAREAIRIYDPTTNKAYCVRSWAGASAEAWPVGTKVSLRISNDLWPINGWSMNGTAYITGWGSFYHEEGEVWITTGTSSTVAFNALKKNSLMVYPLSAKQYVGGAWTDVTAKTYQSGKWVDWYNGEIFPNGNQYTDITGGWKACNGSGQTVTIGSSSIVFTNTGASDRHATAYTVNSLDLSKYTKIIATISIPSTSDDKDGFTLGVTSQNTYNEPTSFVASKTITAESGNMDVTLDISTVTSGYVALYVSRYATVTVTKIRLA